MLIVHDIRFVQKQTFVYDHRIYLSEQVIILIEETSKLVPIRVCVPVAHKTQGDIRSLLGFIDYICAVPAQYTMPLGFFSWH